MTESSVVSLCPILPFPAIKTTTQDVYFEGKDEPKIQIPRPRRTVCTTCPVNSYIGGKNYVLEEGNIKASISDIL